MAAGPGRVKRREVAIKVLSASPDADRLARFERESRATAVPAHPNIVTVFDVGVHEGLPFLVSELRERAFAQGWGKRDWVEHEPDYESLRGDPRSEALLARPP